MQVTKRSLYYWVFAKNTKLQILLLGIILVTVGARVFPLEMQKRIVNQAIELGDMDALVLYCLLYITAVVLAGVLKYVLNILQSYIGHRTLVDMRTRLFEHILTLPLPFFRRTSSGLVISSLVSELAAISEFVGSAVSVPVVNILTFVALSGYMFFLEPWLALLSVIIYPLEFLVIPILQKKFNATNRTRIDTTRTISGLIGESITGVEEVQGNAAVRLERNKFRTLAKELFRLNLRLNILRHGIKFTNNLFQSFGPFILFLVGGYLSIKGRFDIGALVAFLSAYEKVYDPWKELMDFYQVIQDSSVRYSQIMDYFDIEPEFQQIPGDREALALKGDIRVEDVSYVVGSNLRILESITISLKHGEHLALVGFSGSGKSTLALVVGQIFKYSSGKVLIDNQDVSGLTKLDMSSNVGIVAQQPFIFNGTVMENIVYSCEALALNTAEDRDGIRVEVPDIDRVIEVVQQVGLFQDVLRFGLRSVLDQDAYPDLAQALVQARTNLRERHGESLADDVEFFDRTQPLYYSSLAANIVFGTPKDERFDSEGLHTNSYFREFLDERRLTRTLFELGKDTARRTVDLINTLGPSQEVFDESPIPWSDFDQYESVVKRLDNKGEDALKDQDRCLFLKLALAFVPGVHKMGTVSDNLMHDLVRARKVFRQRVKKDHPGAVKLYSEDKYISPQAIQDNILFGKVKTDSAGAEDRVRQLINRMLIEENILEQVLEIGLDFQVGALGDRLSGGQRQKIALARAFLKEPPILILDEATSALDNSSQARIQNLLENKWKGRSSVIAVVHRLDTLGSYDKIAVLKAGKIMEQGEYDTLIERRGALYELVHGRS